MKKRLLITSIVMMLVVAVALSTATYAWFTSNATVDTNAITLTANTSEAPSLGISWVDGNYGTSIEATGPSAGSKFNPATPAALSTTSGSKTLSTVDFNTALTTPTNGGDMVFLANGTSTNVYTWSDNASHTSFFLKNLSPSNPMSSITMTATIQDVTGDANANANQLIRVGVFKKNTSTGNYELLGVLANEVSTAYEPVEVGTEMSDSVIYYKLYLGKYVVATKATATGEGAEAANAAAVAAKTADYYAGMNATAGFYVVDTTAPDLNARAVYGSITANSSVNAMNTVACVTSIDVTEGSGLSAGQKIELVVKVWEDAVALGDAEQGKAASIKLNFSAAATQQ